MSPWAETGDGSPLSRGEFFARSEMVEEKLNALSSRLDELERRQGAPRRALGLLAGPAVRYALAGLGALAAFLAARFGLHLGFP